MISEISLDSHWRCDNLEGDPDNGIDVPLLAAFDARQIESDLARLERYFDLPMQDVCINYDLRIDSVPVGTHLTLNGRDLGEISVPLVLDVTDTVTLEDNTIAFRVVRGAAGAFGSVRLTAVPCET